MGKSWNSSEKPCLTTAVGSITAFVQDFRGCWLRLKHVARIAHYWMVILPSWGA